MKTVYHTGLSLQHSIKRNLVLLILAIFATTTIFANDLMVEPHGAGGAYTTITAAVNAAAATGDRILVYPTGGYTYNENITVSKAVTIQSAYRGQRFSLHGTITFGNVISNLAGANITPATGMPAVVETGGTSTASIRVMNCILNGAVVSNTLSSLYLDHDTITPNNSAVAVSFSRGRVSGCVFNNTQSAIVIQKSGVVTGDTVIIVGNIINMDHNISAVTNGVAGHNPNQFLYIANNFFSYNDAGIGTTPQGSVILVDTLKYTAGIYNAIVNNTYQGRNQGYSYMVATELQGITYTQPSGLLDIENNIFLFYRPNVYAFASAGYAATATLLQYNYSNTGNVSGVAGPNYFNFTNWSAGPFNYPEVGDATLGGNPDNAYLNLDLTRNKPGVFGGSYSLQNFQSDFGSNAAVLFMQTPRVVLVNQSFNISGDGLAR